MVESHSKILKIYDETSKGRPPHLLSGARFGSFNPPIANGTVDLRVNCRDRIFSGIHNSDDKKANVEYKNKHL